MNIPESLKTFFDWSAVITTIAALVSWFPAIAGALGIIWWCYRIRETRLAAKLIAKQLQQLGE